LKISISPKHILHLKNVKILKRVTDKPTIVKTPIHLKKEIDKILNFQKKVLLSNPLLDFDTILTIKRTPQNLGLPANWLGNASIHRSGYDNELALLSPIANGKFTTLYRPPNSGFIGDVDLNFAADKILFSQSKQASPWQVYELNIANKKHKQITPNIANFVDNYDACYLPDGNILYTSTAPMSAVPCINGHGAVANIFLLNTKTKKSRQLCFDQESNWCPTIMNNGRVLYLRWEYTDLPHSNSRILFEMNPDGTGQRAYYGSNSYWPNGVFYARPIPGKNTQVVGIVTGHHGDKRVGELTIFDSAKGRNEADGVVQQIPGYHKKVKAIVKDRLVEGVWPKFLHPYPLGKADGTGSGKYFIVSAQLTKRGKWGIYLVDIFDNMLLLKEDDKYALLEPIPFKKHLIPPIIPNKIDLKSKEATVYISDIYHGPGLKSIPRGEVKALQLFSYTFGYRNFGGLYGTIGMDGPWDIKRVIGTVPIEKDGSASFKIPANTPIGILPLDKDGKALQIMRSWFVGMPGEVVSCIGCHEDLNETPAPSINIAASKQPTPLKNWEDDVHGFSYPLEIQPILNRNCVKCHNNKTTYKGKPLFSLKGDPYPKAWYSVMKGKQNKQLGGKFSTSYNYLHRYVRRPGIESDMHLLTAMEFHADQTELVQILKKGHHGIKLTPQESKKIYTWIDLNAPYHGRWSAIVGTEAVISENIRADMRKKYANVDENHEYLPTIKNKNIPTPIIKIPEEIRPKITITNQQPTKLTIKEKIIKLTDKISITLVYIPAGKFVMGSNRGLEDEKQRIVTIKNGFWMAKTEITNEQYACFDPNHDSRLESRHGYQFGVTGYPANTPKQPVVRISNKQAEQFCQWLSKKINHKIKLPTEEQWEYACRAGTTTPFFFGNLNADFTKYANLGDLQLRNFVCDPYKYNIPLSKNPPEFDDWIPKNNKYNDSSFISAKVGKYQANPWGLYDMHGNVWEWTSSTYGNTSEKVARGGSWYDRPKRCTASYRISYRPYQPVFNVGFRIIMLK